LHNVTLRTVIVSLAAVALLAASGCGQKGPKLFPISGTVKFKDGTPVQGPDYGRAKITFTPASTDVDIKEGEIAQSGAGGDIEAQGRFTMSTYKKGDGVMPGKYKVLLRVWQGADDSTSAIDPKYSDRDATDIDVTVDGPKKDLEFAVEKKR
jgi:predicted small lipoprotein YifL